MCKKFYYRNCDSGTSSNEYCIFHKPNKSEKEAKEFWEKIIKTFKPKIEVIKINEKVKIRHLIFESFANFRGYVFPSVFGWSYFEYAVFMDGVSFEDCVFEGSISFKKATFHGRVTFRNTKFKEEADFSKAHFIGPPDFTNAEFKGPVYFVQTEFSPIMTLNISDLFKINEKDCILRHNAVLFEKTKFWGPVIFLFATFDTLLFMTGAYFHSIRESLLEEENIKTITFKYALDEVELWRALRSSCERLHLSEEADHSFVHEMRALRRWRTQRKILVADAIRQEISESIMRLRNIYFIGKPSLLSLLKGYLYLAYLGVKSWFIRITAYLNNFIEFLVADITCEYGVNWIRPIVIWLTTVLLFFPTLYTTITLLGYQVISPTGNNLSNLIKTSIHFSVVTATRLGYGNVHSVGVGEIIASIEAIFSTFIWSVFLVVFARKYMKN